jgi:hypothetical protein
MAIRVSAIRTSRALLPRNIVWYSFLLEKDLQGLVRPEGLDKLKKLIPFIGPRTRDLPARSIAP